ncbi:substrate-binding domain-containing protein [Sulfitobacter sp. HNIBRBA2951]|uniref:substrate-binding domain-containing protein n=1 Tax=Sulfitobacter aquimarinus TaxID=3158557 RepID=UPI0032E04A96
MIRLFFAIFLSLTATAVAAQDNLRMAVTTSFHNSGLSDVLLPAIRQDIGIEVQLLVVGTGQALKLGQAGDVDAILVHSRAAEVAFVADGFGSHRREIMYNDFVLIGPVDTLPDLGKSAGITQALQQVAKANAPFVSRGDDSGTHKTELRLWQDAGLASEGFGPWYKPVGAGMGAALNTAAGLGAYVLSDRASWLNFGNKSGLGIVFEGDPALFNQYAFLPVSAARHPHVRSALVKKLEAWLTSPRAADLINGYQINGEALFTFNASDKP